MMALGAKALLGLLLYPCIVISGLTPDGTGQVIPRTGERAKEKSGENDPARIEEAKRWIARSLAAYGGNERLAALTDLSFESQSPTTATNNPIIRFKVYFKGTDKFRSEVSGSKSGEVSGSDFFAITIINGPSAWLKSEQTLIELTAGDAEPLMISTQLQSQPYVIFDRLTKFWTEGERTVDGVRYAVIGTSGFLGKNFARGEISLDLQTFIIRRFEYEEEVEAKQGRGVNKYDLRYEDYRAFGGIQFPTRVRSIQPGATSTTTFSDFKVNPGVPDSYFEKPK
jgi:outer membrane lipoprotein-sorting protein